jgi:hypothetical protein
MTDKPQAEHPWVVRLRQKLRERGFTGDHLEKELDRILERVPSLRGKKADPDAALHRAITKRWHQ